MVDKDFQVEPPFLGIKNTPVFNHESRRTYLLTTLYNAPTTIGSYYSALVQHDLYGGGSRD